MVNLDWCAVNPVAAECTGLLCVQGRQTPNPLPVCAHSLTEMINNVLDFSHIQLTVIIGTTAV